MLVSMARKSMINVRLADLTHEEFKIVAELRGASMSTLLHQFIVKAIREEKDREPSAFKFADIESKIVPVADAPELTKDELEEIAKDEEAYWGKSATNQLVPLAKTEATGELRGQLEDANRENQNKKKTG